MFGDKTIRT